MGIGFIGLGIMGKPMAGHLLQAGHELIVYNRSQGAVDELVRHGAQAAASPRAVAEAAEIIITMLPDAPEVEEVVLGPGGLREGLTSGKIVIDMSSISPRAAIRLHGELSALGVQLLDAPVSGGESGAVAGKLAIMAGGDRDTYERCLPLLQAMGETITRVGEIGSGNTVKLMNQIIVAVTMGAVAEAVALGCRAGVDPAIAYEAIKDGLAGSRVLDNKLENMRDERYVPGFKVKLHYKDLRNALAAGEQTAAELPLTTALQGMLGQLCEQGYGEEDHSAVARLYGGGRRGDETL